jgi:hypothetical protein
VTLPTLFARGKTSPPASTRGISRHSARGGTIRWFATRPSCRSSRPSTTTTAHRGDDSGCSTKSSFATARSPTAAHAECSTTA